MVSKKGKITVKIRRKERTEAAGSEKIRPRFDGQENGLRLLEHNRKKRYILEEGIPVPFLVDLGVMTAEGKVVRSVMINTARSTGSWNLSKIFSRIWILRESL